MQAVKCPDRDASVDAPIAGTLGRQAGERRREPSAVENGLPASSNRTRGMGGVANVRRFDSASYPRRTLAKSPASGVVDAGAPIQ
jgi:hypothetical protein